MVRVGQVAGIVPDEDLSYVVIAPFFGDQWMFIKHRRRGGYELPAGHLNTGENSSEAAVRELVEETGAEEFRVEPVTFYEVENDGVIQYGRLFIAEVSSFNGPVDKEEIEGVYLMSELPGELSLVEVMTFLFRIAEGIVR